MFNNKTVSHGCSHAWAHKTLADDIFVVTVGKFGNLFTGLHLEKYT